MRVFISYAREDEDTAWRLYSDLKRLGATPWLDKENILPGQDWERAIQAAIRESSYFIAVISENSVAKRGYVQKELRFALDVLDQFPPGSIFVIPVRIDESEPRHTRLAGLHWVDLFPSYEDGLARICRSLELEFSPVSKVSEAETQDATSDAGLEIPSQVLEAIRDQAREDFPEDFSTQKYVIDSQIKAWHQLQEYDPSSLPNDVRERILAEARRQYPDDFSTQFYVVQNQASAWKQVQDLEADDVPAHIVGQIVKRAKESHPRDYSTQLYVIRNQLQAWRDLNS